MPRLSAVLVPAVVLISTSSCKAQPTTPAAYGRKIIAPEKPGDTLQSAITDLRGALQTMTAQEYAITPGQSGPGILLLRTDSPLAPPDAVVQLKGKGREPFIIRAKDDSTLWIIANDEEGLSHGIYFYLEQLGCHWFLPNEKWAVIPKNKPVSVKIDRLVAPTFKVRGFFGTGAFGATAPYDPKYDKDGRLQFRIRTEDWKRRNRFGGEYTLDGHAGEDFNLRHKETLVANPALLAEVGGKREWGITAKLDASNPAAVKLWVDDRVAAYRAKQKASPNTAWSYAVSVDPADGAGFCTCPKCKQLFASNGENEVTFYSNQAFHMANEVAKAVRQEFPDGFVNLYAYADHSAPPTFDLEPNVHVCVIPYGFNYSGLAPDDFIAAWGKKAKNLSLYDYWSIPDWAWDQPTFDYLNAGPEKIRYWAAHNIHGFSSESTYGAGAMGPAWYLTGRLMWDPNVNDKAILESFYRKSFGPAAPAMKRMLERWSTTFLLSSQELALSFKDLQEAETLTAGQSDLQGRVDDFGRYVHFLRLYHQYSTATEEAVRVETKRKLVEHLFDIYETNMVHSFRLYQFLVDYGRDTALYAEFDPEKPEAPGWKRIAPLSHSEVAALIEDGVKSFPPLDFEPQAYSGKLVPLAATSTPIQDKWTSRMGSRGGMTIEIQTPPTLKTLKLRVDQYYDNEIQVKDANGKSIYSLALKGKKDNYTPFEFSVPIPTPGSYTVQFRPAPNGGFWFQTTPDIRLAMRDFLPEMGDPSPRIYFYVPVGKKTVAIWHPQGEKNNPLEVLDPAGQSAPVEYHDGGKMVLIKIPAGQDGRTWSLNQVRTPNYPLRMLNTPQTFSLTPDSLLVPSDALK